MNKNNSNSAAAQQLKDELKNSFNELTDRKLLALYNYTLKSQITLEELAEIYETQVTKSYEFTRVHAGIRDEIRNDLINDILEEIERIPPKLDENKPIKIEDVKLKPAETKNSFVRIPPILPKIHLKPLPPKLSPQEVKPKRYDESDECKNNQSSIEKTKFGYLSKKTRKSRILSPYLRIFRGFSLNSFTCTPIHYSINF